MVPGGKGNGRGGKHLEIRIDIYTLKVKKLKVFIAQLSPTLCDPMDCGLPGSSVHGTFQANEYCSGLPFLSRGDLPHPGIEPGSPALASKFFNV